MAKRVATDPSQLWNTRISHSGVSEGCLAKYRLNGVGKHTDINNSIARNSVLLGWIVLGVI